MTVKALSLDEDVVVATLGLTLAGEDCEFLDLSLWERSFAQNLAGRVNSLNHAALGKLQSNTIALCGPVVLAPSSCKPRFRS